MVYILDALVILVFIIPLIIGIKNGFVKTVSKLLCYLVAFVIAFSFSEKIAGYVYDSFINEKIVSQITENIESFKKSGDITAKHIEESLNETFNNNNVLKLVSDKLNIDTAQIESILSENLSDTARGIAEKITVKIVRPLAVSLLKSIVFLLMVIILFLLVKPVSLLIDKIFSFSLLGSLNKFLGGISGAFIGVLFAVILSYAVNGIVSLNEAGFFGITQRTINDTYIFSMLIKML